MSLFSECSNPGLIAIVGPTATGKTDVGLRVAEILDGEIVSADSMQIWREMDIGTAKASPQQRQRVPFHLIDVVDFRETFSAAQFQALARTAVEDIRSRGKTAVLVGGTGLYIRALIDDFQFPPQAPPDVRSRLRSEATLLGSQTMWERLRQVDAASAARISPNDTKRIVRALEVYETTGESASLFGSRNSAPETSPWLQFGLACPPGTLAQRINERVDRMMEQGFEEEVRGLLAKGLTPGLQSAQALGYQEMLRYLHGEISLTEAVEFIKVNTRRYAKRQRTWFRPDRRIRWLESNLSPDALAIYITAVVAGTGGPS